MGQIRCPHEDMSRIKYVQVHLAAALSEQEIVILRGSFDSLERLLAQCFAPFCCLLYPDPRTGIFRLPNLVA
jgi:hypothetical protein